MVTNNEVVNEYGFTLIELMIVVAIIAIIAAIAYPNYQKYVFKTKRADMMSEMQNIASKIQSQKALSGRYSNISTATINTWTGDYPKNGTAWYNVTISPSPLTSKWEIKAIPKGKMEGDGNLTLNYQGMKCHHKSSTQKYCGMDNEWRKK